MTLDKIVEKFLLWKMYVFIRFGNRAWYARLVKKSKKR